MVLPAPDGEEMILGLRGQTRRARPLLLEALTLALEQRPPDDPTSYAYLLDQAYPQIAPLTLDLPPDQVYELVRRAAQNRGWDVIESARPGGRVGLGRLDAVDRTFLLRLADDVTVRIRPRADGARIDVRSASRLGQHDLGKNAERIQRFCRPGAICISASV